MFEASNDIDIFTLKKDLIVISLSGVSIISKNGTTIYKNGYAVCRLLSVDELKRLDTINNENAQVHDSVEYSVATTTLLDYIGINKDEIDYDASDAGLIPRIANAVIIKSLEILKDPLSRLAAYEQEISFTETISAIVSRYMNIPYTEVTGMPVNKVLRLFSICKKAFPTEVRIGEEGPEE